MYMYIVNENAFTLFYCYYCYYFFTAVYLPFFALHRKIVDIFPSLDSFASHKEWFILNKVRNELFRRPVFLFIKCI